MKFSFVFLTLAVCSLARAPVKPLSFRNLLPWASDIPQEEYKSYIKIHLVDNKWWPTDVKDLPSGENPAPSYQGDPIDAYKAFKNVDITYPSHLKPFEGAMELLTGYFGYDKTLETIFIFDTLSGNARVSMIENTVLAMVMRNMLKKYNVFVLDFENLEGTLEVAAAKAAFGIKSGYYGLAKTIGDFIHSAVGQGLMSVEQIHLVGYCFSSQLAGFIARYLQTLGNRKVKSILALDPHSVGLSRLRYKFVSADDAEVVHVYHTNSIGLGTFRRAGTADIVFNNGLWQPGCAVDNICSHNRAPVLLWYVIIYPEKFVARKCSSWFAFKFWFCKSKDTILLTFPPEKNNKAVGNFYINTKSVYPFGYGADGAK